jgi:hypothetical protein
MRSGSRNSDAYPNPVTSLLHVSIAEGSRSLEVLDILGRVVKHFDFSEPRSEDSEVIVDMSGLPDGSYMLLQGNSFEYVQHIH